MLLERVQAYMRLTKTSPTRFGREAVGDPNFVLNLQVGRQPRDATIRKVLAFIEAREGSAGAEGTR